MNSKEEGGEIPVASSMVVAINQETKRMKGTFLFFMEILTCSRFST